jgi:hypothetical protein
VSGPYCNVVAPDAGPGDGGPEDGGPEDGGPVDAGPMLNSCVAGTVPLPPPQVNATAGGGVASVTWLVPSDEGAPITSYEVTAIPGGDTVTTDGSTTMAVLSLTVGTSYQFTVSATNMYGTGNPSAKSNIVVPVVPCGSDINCPSNTPYCDQDPGVMICVAPCTQGYGCDTCLATLQDEKCGCTSSGACVPDACTYAMNCKTDVLATYCDPTSLNCVECLADTDCPAYNDPVSDLYCIADACAPCGSNQDCQSSRGGLVCNSGVCGCDSDSDCVGVARGPSCNTTTHECG